MNMEYIILSAMWIAFCAVHSFLISITVTEFMKVKLKERYRFYRLFYNFFSIVTIIPVLMYTWSINGEYIFIWSGYMNIVRAAMFAAAGILFIPALLEYDMLQIMGIRQIMSGRSGRALSENGAIKDTGILGMVRHPFYSAVFLLLWTGNLTMVFIIVNIILSVYLVIGTILEEHKLVAEFGTEYREYQKKVSMFFPVKWLQRAAVSSVLKK